MTRNSPKTPSKDRKLTPKEKKLCEELLIDGNKKQAGIRAGYSPRSATEIVNQTLRKHHVKAYYQALLSAQAARTRITGDKIINELAAIAFFQLQEILEVEDHKVIIKNSSKWTQSAHKAVESIKIDKDGALHIKAHSKIAPLKYLGDHFGMFTDYNVALAALSRYGYVTDLADGGKGFEFRECMPGDEPEGEGEEEEEDDDE